MSRAYIVATIDDALHFTPDQRKEIIKSYPPHELEARVKGIPQLGSGRVFPVPENRIAIEHREIPSHWARIAGLDFGWTHAFAAAELAWDRDADVVYLVRTYKIKETTPIVHAAALRAWGRDLRFAWPKDGRQETLAGAGVPLAEQYRAQGLDLLPDHAQFTDGGTSVEAGVMEMLTRMESGHFKVFRHLEDFWSEFRLYHRRDGKIFKENDDLLCAVRYAIMSLRFARTVRQFDSFRREIKYPKLSIV